MRGWRFTTTGEPLVLVEQEDPRPGPGEVLIDIKASGLCHSDVGALEDPGWLHLVTKRPVIFGHEFAGVIAELGEGVSGYRVGDRVGVCPVGKSGTTPGYSRDGGYATRAVAPAEDLVPVPDGVPLTLAAAGTDAGMTSYHAVMVRGGVRPGMKVGIIGLGGLGQIGARAAVVAGAEVYGADVSPAARELAGEIGLSGVVDDASALARFGCELIVDFAGFGTTTAAAIAAVARRGRVVLVGMGRLEATIDTRLLIVKQVDLLGSAGGTTDDIAGVYGLFASGALAPKLTTIGFEDIGRGLDDLARGEVQGRLVAVVE